MTIRRPFNLKKWITDNRDLLKPPVGNKNLYADAGDYIVIILYPILFILNTIYKTQHNNFYFFIYLICFLG